MIEVARVGEFLRARFAGFHPHAASVEFIGAGMFSQAFAFVADEREFILRVNAYEEDFRKDEFAFANFAAPALPIPRVAHIGRFDDTRWYAITARCAGKIITAWDSATNLKIAPSLFETLDAIHRVDASRFSGWGLTDAHYHGRFDSWENYLLSLYNQKFKVDWRILAQHTFLEANVFAEFFDAMRELLPYCPREKFLVHGDFGFENVVSDGERITGVLDWAEARLGDFLYDVAYLDFWSKDVPYGDLWYARALKQGRVVQHFEERMRCYLLNQGLGSLIIPAIRGDEREYLRVRERMRSIFLPGRRAATDWTQ